VLLSHRPCLWSPGFMLVLQSLLAPRSPQPAARSLLQRAQ
jgi:hypothetical protein